MCRDGGGAAHRAVADLEGVRGALRGPARGRERFEVGQHLVGDRRAGAGIIRQMTAVLVERHRESGRVVSVCGAGSEFPEPRGHVGVQRCGEAVHTVEHLILIEDDFFPEAVGLDVVDEFGQVLFRPRGKNLGDGVRRVVGALW